VTKKIKLKFKMIAALRLDYHLHYSPLGYGISCSRVVYTQNMETGYSSGTLIASQEIIYTLKMEAACSSKTLIYAGVPGGKIGILEGHSIGHSKQKFVYTVPNLSLEQ
jgi:hypothetical protein